MGKSLQRTDATTGGTSQLIRTPRVTHSEKPVPTRGTLLQPRPVPFRRPQLTRAALRRSIPHHSEHARSWVLHVCNSSSYFGAGTLPSVQTQRRGVQKLAGNIWRAQRRDRNIGPQRLTPAQPADKQLDDSGPLWAGIAALQVWPLSRRYNWQITALWRHES